MSKNKSDSELVSNRRATHDYEILDTYEAGIVLKGTEIKSLRDHGGSLQDAYVLVAATGDVILKNSSIAPYRFGGVFNHEERRDRKLLLHKREIAKLKSLSQEKGLTLIPLAMYLKKGIAENQNRRRPRQTRLRQTRRSKRKRTQACNRPRDERP